LARKKLNTPSGVNARAGMAAKPPANSPIGAMLDVKRIPYKSLKTNSLYPI
jgi:hypothetical protein